MVKVIHKVCVIVTRQVDMANMPIGVGDILI